MENILFLTVEQMGHLRNMRRTKVANYTAIKEYSVKAMILQSE